MTDAACGDDPSDRPRTSRVLHLLTRPPVVILVIVMTLALVGLAELWMGREPMCTCGYISLWHGAVDSQHSQQISDWYTFTHIEHGILFYALLALVAPGRPGPVPARLLLAVLAEGAWEVVENSPFIIDRYRTATLSLDYYGDSVVNSLADILAMMAGFWAARRASMWVTALFVVAVEVMLALTIRDNLALNIIMLIHPIDAIKRWQLGS